MPSSARAVTTWIWSFGTNNPQISGSGTFTTADVEPEADTSYEITGISGTYNFGGIAYTITRLTDPGDAVFRWDGTQSSPILTAEDENIRFFISNGGDPFQAFFVNGDLGGFAPIDRTFNDLPPAVTTVGVTTSLLQPVLDPPASVPGPLPLFGAAAAFGWSRRLRRRIKLGS
jgi:hypothetical protein